MWNDILLGRAPLVELPTGRRHVCEDEPEGPDTYDGVECSDSELAESRLNRVYGKLRVLRKARDDIHGKRAWWVRCDCGVTRMVRGYDLRANRYQSCGCVRAGMLSAGLHRKAK